VCVCVCVCLLSRFQYEAAVAVDCCRLCMMIAEGFRAENLVHVPYVVQASMSQNSSRHWSFLCSLTDFHWKGSGSLYVRSQKNLWDGIKEGVLSFSGLTLLVGHQEERPACKNWVMRCWCGYVSGTRCRLFVYGPADATVSQNPTFSCLI